MKRFILALVLILTLGATAFAQQPVKNDSPWNLKAKSSVAAFGAAMVADCLSSRGLHENNPLLRNARGRVNQGACFGLNAGALGLTVLLQRKYPRGMNWLRFIGAGVHAGAATRNWAQ